MNIQEELILIKNRIKELEELIMQRKQKNTKILKNTNRKGAQNCNQTKNYIDLI